ncbi:hypothetical protein DDE74_00355 [Streptomyces lydicus]|uniref:Uncharacterized protein n=1 Tax=Streptomyces lydicus TaxID=47763 RepID=A0A3Q9K6H6_9ACTN|nr:hypothetical protein DDE74_00355 [Streptomyces lydicus]
MLAMSAAGEVLLGCQPFTPYVRADPSRSMSVRDSPTAISRSDASGHAGPWAGLMSQLNGVAPSVSWDAGHLMA